MVSSNAADTGGLQRNTVLVMALASGMVVANNYYAQPLVAELAAALNAPEPSIGLVVTASQIGYAVGLALLVPLGDLIERRRLLLTVLSVTTLALLGMALAPDWRVLAIAALLVGVSSVVGQVLVPFAASLARPDEQGRTIGNVMTGLLLGILLSRVVSGLVAQVAGWRAVFWLAAGLMVVTALLLYRRLPVVQPSADTGYAALLRSVLRIVWEERQLRLRMVYGVTTYASFGVFWTSIGFVLSGPGFGWNDAQIGLFTLFGVLGALGAKFAGVTADRGFARVQTGAFIALTAASFGLLAFGRTSVAVLAIGVALLDLGIQGTHISNQSVFYPLRPNARSRLNTAYMTSYFASGSVGSALSAVTYASFGWSGVCVVGAAFPTIGFLVWVGERFRAPGVRASPVESGASAVHTPEGPSSLAQ